MMTRNVGQGLSPEEILNQGGISTKTFDPPNQPDKIIKSCDSYDDLSESQLEKVMEEVQKTLLMKKYNHLIPLLLKNIDFINKSESSVLVISKKESLAFRIFTLDEEVEETETEPFIKSYYSNESDSEKMVMVR